MDWSFILSQWDFILFWFLSDVEKKVLISLRTIFKYSSQQPPISVGLLCVLFWQPGLSWLTRFITFEVGQEVGFTEYFTVLLYGFDILYISHPSAFTLEDGAYSRTTRNQFATELTNRDHTHKNVCDVPAVVLISLIFTFLETSIVQPSPSHTENMFKFILM